MQWETAVASMRRKRIPQNYETKFCVSECVLRDDLADARTPGSWSRLEDKEREQLKSDESAAVTWASAMWLG